jgi:ribosomal-protein-alanine N-acetyltransferase
MNLRRASFADCEILEFLHASCFPDEPWDAVAIAGLLASPGMFALLALKGGEGWGGEGWPAGFVLARAIAGEAEIITIAVSPAHQRAGLGTALLEGALESTRAAGAEAVFLEVAENNNPAYQLYTRHGFIKIGRRPNYYRQKDAAVAALVMKVELPQSSADHS